MTAPTEVKVPDIGDFDNVPVIEVHVSIGDQVNADDPLVTLESDKATMDVPAPAAGSVAEVLVKIGDEVSEGTPILLLHPGDGALTTPPSLVEQQEPPPSAPAPTPAAEPAGGPATAPVHAAAAREAPTPAAAGITTLDSLHAGPSVRRMARELGIDLEAVAATGPKGRITKDDLLSFLKGPAQPARPRRQAGRGRCRDPGDPRAGLLEVRPDRDGVAVPDQEDVGAVPAPVVAERPARDP